MNILFVCLGNICRSPLAEVVLANLAREEGLSDLLFLDSAGTQGYHEGELADPRSRAVAKRHGMEITHRARGLRESDYESFDLLIAMDQSNAEELRRRAPNAAARRKVRLFREWDPSGPGEIPDPYYGGESDFEHVLHLCQRSAPRLLAEVSRGASR